MYRATFTFFVPAPPLRKSGYREVEFDKIMRGIMESGFELEELKTVTSANGIFLIGLLRTTSKKVFESDAQLNIHERFKLSHVHSSPDIVLDEEQDV